MVKFETRLIPFTSRDGRKGTFPLRYKLYLNEEGKVYSIMNQHGYTIEKNSETFEYYAKKY